MDILYPFSKISKDLFLLTLVYFVSFYGVAQTPATALFWVQSSGAAANDQLVKSNLDGSGAVVLASGASHFANPQKIAVDKPNNKIYVADVVSGGVGIVQYDLDGTNRVTIAPPSGSFQYNDIQVTNGFLYWVQSSGTPANDRLVRANLDGSNVTVLASGASNFVNPMNLAVDPINQYIFVADPSMAGAVGIVRYDLNGNNRTVVAAPSTSFQYNGLDVAGNFLYWVQSSGTAANDQLVRANLDGSNATVLASGASNFANPQNISVNMTNGYIYVADPIATEAVGIVRYDLNGGNRTVIAAPSSSFQYNGIALNTDYSILPVTLVSFRAYEQEDKVTVQWETAAAFNLDRYELEKSATGTNFIKLAEIPGNAVQYRWTDIHPFEGNNFYRVRAVDIGGQGKYSSVIRISINKNKKGIAVYPNAVTGGAFTLQISNLRAGSYHIKLISAAGQVIFTRKILHNGENSTQNIPLPANTPRGNYWLRLYNNSEKNFSVNMVVE